jgi:hypothetical protein
MDPPADEFTSALRADAEPRLRRPGHEARDPQAKTLASTFDPGRKRWCGDYRTPDGIRVCPATVLLATLV